MLAVAGTAAGLALSGDPEVAQTVVVTETAPGKTVTVETPPPPAEPSRSLSSAAAANDGAYRMMLNEDFEGALPILEDAYGTLAGSGTEAEAYTAYNLAFTRFALGSCQDVLPLLDHSESIQGERREISRLRHRAEKSCDGSKGSDKGDD